ncbi:MAG TPA: ZIP family metal transporter, partial [Bacteroidia bacterium]|nr:ZIP family metal transporter [Bacteroidia bacterium]
MLLVKYGLIAFISVLLSGMILLVVKIPRNPLRLLLAFSGAFLFAISLLHLIPELYGAGEENHNHPLHSATETGIWILVGFLIQLLLEYISEGIEHGHVHLHAHEHEVNKHGHARIPLGVVSGLCLHSFLEGMPLGVETDDPKIFPPFLTGIVLHNIPIAIAFIGLLLHMGHSKPSAFLLLGLFAIMTPAGMLASNFIGDQLQGD